MRYVNELQSQHSWPPLRLELAAEKERCVEEVRLRLEQEKEEAVAETKKHQWVC